MSAAERAAPDAIALQIVVRPTPKHAQTMGPLLFNPSADFPDNSNRR